MTPRILGVLVALGLGACGRLGFDSVEATHVDPGARVLAVELWTATGERFDTPMAPTFDPEIDRYTVDVGLAVSSIQVSATPEDPDTAITIDGVSTAPGDRSAPIALGLGTTSILVEGTSPSGSEASYVIDVVRGGDVTEEAYLKASNTTASDRFGDRVTVSGNTLVVGAYAEGTGAPESGAVYVFVRVGTAWTQQAFLKAPTAGADDHFGRAISISGDTLAVGAPGDFDTSNRGAVYVFARTGTTWSQQAYLVGSTAADHFGHAVSISGGTLAIGAYGEDTGGSASGAAYVFTRSGTAWSQQAYLKASNVEASDGFGWSVSVAGDTAAVGACGEDSSANGVGGDQADNAAAGSGAVYVFTRTGSAWSQQAYLKASNTDAADLFGESVAASGDTLVIGAASEDGTNNTENQAGAAYVFRRVGTTWAQEAYLKGSNTVAVNSFGRVVAISTDTIVVGGEQQGVAEGAAYVFTREGSRWTQAAYLKASNAENYDSFGSAVAISGDTIAVGAFGEDSSATGVNGDQADNGAPLSGAVYVLR